MIDLDDPVDPALEAHLRHVLVSVAATSTVQRSEHTSSALARRPLATAIAAALLVGGVSATAWVATRPEVDDVPASLPAWHQALAPLLPDGFDHVAVTQSHELFVQFQAFDPTTSLSLELTVTRGAMSPDPSGAITLAEAQEQPWPDPNADLNVSLPDGRQIGVACSSPMLDQDQPSCPRLGGRRVTGEVIRELALALAQFDVDLLPPPDDELEHVPPSVLDEAVRRITDLPQTYQLDAPHYATSAASYGPDPDSMGPLVISAVAGFVPRLSVDTRTMEREASITTWRTMPDGSLWTVTADPALGADIGARILAAGLDLSTDESEADLPDWYRAIAPALPDGFDHIGIIESSEALVAFEAVDLRTGRALYLSVGREPTTEPGGQRITLDLARSRAWTDAGSLPDVVLPDGRLVGVACSVIGLTDPGTCPPLGGATSDPEDLRALTLALAELPLDVLPPVDEIAIPSGTDTTSIAARAASAADAPATTGGEQGRWLTNVSFGEAEVGVPALQVHVVHEIVPVATDGEIRSAELVGRTIAWRPMPDGSLWAVSATDGLAPGVPAAVLDAVLAQLSGGTIPTLPLIPVTVPAP